MTAGSGVNMLGNSQGIDVPIAPTTSPIRAPIMTSDFSSIRACLISSALFRFCQTEIHIVIVSKSTSFLYNMTHSTDMECHMRRVYKRATMTEVSWWHSCHVIHYNEEPGETIRGYPVSSIHREWSSSNAIIVQQKNLSVFKPTISIIFTMSFTKSSSTAMS